MKGSNVSCAWAGNRPGSLAARPVLTNRMREFFTYGSVGGAGGNPGPYPAVQPSLRDGWRGSACEPWVEIHG